MRTATREPSLRRLSFAYVSHLPRLVDKIAHLSPLLQRKLTETITQVKNRGDWKLAATFFGELVEVVLGLPNWDYNREVCVYHLIVTLLRNLTRIS
jgi:hypothetical protein